MSSAPCDAPRAGRDTHQPKSNILLWVLFSLTAWKRRHWVAFP